MGLKIFITGSSDGIGFLTGKVLVDRGHTVVFHARNATRADDIRRAVPRAYAILIGDLSSIAETIRLAQDANTVLDCFDTIIHNAGINYPSTLTTRDNIAPMFAINTLAPFILTCLMKPPTSRLLYMSSNDHTWGDPSLFGDVAHNNRYADTKAYDVMLAKAVSRCRWATRIQVVSMDPNWVPTRMGGRSAPDDLNSTIIALSEWAEGRGKCAYLKPGGYFSPQGEKQPHHGTEDIGKQAKLIQICQHLSSIALPGSTL